MSRSFELSEVDWVTVGTVGEPGHRTFYIQFRKGGDTIALKLEKQQVATLAQFLEEILSDLPSPAGVPEEGALDLVEPVVAEWTVGRLQLAYDSTEDRIVILADELDPAGFDIDEESDVPQDPNPDLGSGRVGLSRPQAAAVARRGVELVGAGRPSCMLCGHPMDPEGHSCPRTNGHRPSP